MRPDRHLITIYQKCTSDETKHATTEHSLLDLCRDTTNEHHSHIYDLNCRTCCRTDNRRNNDDDDDGEQLKMTIDNEHEKVRDNT